MGGEPLSLGSAPHAEGFRPPGEDMTVALLKSNHDQAIPATVDYVNDSGTVALLGAARRHVTRLGGS